MLSVAAPRPSGMSRKRDSSMRKVGGMLAVATVLLPIGMLAAPAGAASGVVCKTATGAATFSPALPKVGATTKVKAAITITGAKLGSCSGGGVTSGILNAKLNFGIAGNCSSLMAGSNAGIKGTEVITWNNKKTSTIALTLTGLKNPTQTSATGVVTAGLFKGMKQSGNLQYALPTGGCTKAGLAKVTFKQLTAIVIK
jgi:hypothetical protein